MKKNKMMRLASLLLVAVLLTTSIIGGTFAKYVSEATVSDSAIVADWAFEVNDTDITETKNLVVDLFGTVSDDTTLTGDDANVANAASGANAIIAPGTGGSFQLKVKNTSQVAANYALDFTVDEDGVPLWFKVDNGEWTDDLADVAASNDTTLAIGSEAKTITVYWQWKFEGGTGAAQTDETDTTLGTADTKAAPTVQVKITATQVD